MNKIKINRVTRVHSLLIIIYRLNKIEARCDVQ